MSWCDSVQEPRILVAPDPGTDGNGLGQMISLRHPKSGNATQYLFVNGMLQELQWFKNLYGSWFLGDYITEDGRMYLSTPIDPVFIMLPIFEEARMKKGDDLGRFRQLDEILFIDGYPGYMQLMSVVENCMLVVSEVKEIGSSKFFRLDDSKVLRWLCYKVCQLKQTLPKLDKNYAVQSEKDTLIDAVSILGEYLKEKPWLQLLCDHLKLNILEVTGKAQVNAEESNPGLRNELQEQSNDKKATTAKKGRQAKKLLSVQRSSSSSPFVLETQFLPSLSIFIRWYSSSAAAARPCRAFIPRLVELYETLRKRGINLEIIFISFDRDEDGFKEHFKNMPWLAVPFDVSLHRRLIDRYRIDRIPSFVPLCSDGITIEEDLIGCIEDYGADAFPFTRKRHEELKAIDIRKREEANLEELLGHKGCHFLISGDDRKVPISELAGKTIGLYFGAYWSPPCCAFTVQLTDAYNNLKVEKGDCFEIVLISTDRDLEEFNVNKSSMPWLAVPYEDRTRHDLRRIFDVKGIPALVLIGPDGKVISVNGKLMVSSYGAEAFPFTESRIRDLEAALRKEGEALPQQVEDVKHEHVLKLDMAKAYVCDSCKKQGKFWTFSCDVCDYDLHPSCLEKVNKD
ncbi:putative nucleoredoxin 3 [Glycine soja]